MKVLHIWNPASIASTIAKYQAKLLGWNTWVIARRAIDKYCLTVYGELLDCGSREFATIALLKARKYDIIHVHMLDKLIPILKIVYPWKKIILHYHGSDIRGKWRQKQKYWRRADLIIVSTPDLLEGAPENTHYLPNPVDTELFKPKPELRSPGTALFITSSEPKHQTSQQWAINVARKLNLKLDIVNREKTIIPYRKLPLLLNRYEYFIDHRWVPALSKTALEALACGLKVVRWDEKIIQGLPEQHKPEHVVRKLTKLYLTILM